MLEDYRPVSMSSAMNVPVIKKIHDEAVDKSVFVENIFS